MRGWSFRRDAAGRPRRFLSHGEALLWSLCIGLAVAFGFAAPVLFRYLLYSIGLQDEQPFSFVRVMFPVFVFLTVSVLLYLYIALSGGVMDRAARRRYLEGETWQRR